MNNQKNENPFLNLKKPRPWGAGTFEMALPLVHATKITNGMRILEVGAGSGQVATVLARDWDAHVVTLEPWGE